MQKRAEAIEEMSVSAAEAEQALTEALNAEVSGGDASDE